MGLGLNSHCKLGLLPIIQQILILKCYISELETSTGISLSLPTVSSFWLDY